MRGMLSENDLRIRAQRRLCYSNVEHNASQTPMQDMTCRFHLYLRAALGFAERLVFSFSSRRVMQLLHCRKCAPET